MRLTGYADMLSYTQRNRTTTELKARMDIVATEAVTGLKANLTEATNGRVGEAHLLQKAINDIDKSSDLNDLSKTRIDLISAGISGAREAMDDIGSRGTIAIQTGSAIGINAISDEAEDSLKNVMSALSIKHGTRSLLSGDAASQPVYADPQVLLDDISAIMQTAGEANDIDAALDRYFNDPAGGFQTRIYQGGDGTAPALRSSTTQTVDLLVRGDDQAFKDTLRGLAVLAVADDIPNGLESDEFSDVFSAGLAKANTGNTGLITAEGQVGILGQSLERTADNVAAERLTLSAALQNMIGRDQFEAAAELQQLEVALEGSYIITGRLADLTLTNYL